METPPTKVLDWFVDPRRFPGSEALLRARIVAYLAMVGAATALTSGTLVLATAGLLPAGPTLLFGLGALAVLLGLRRGLSPPVGFWFLQLSTALHFLALSAVESELDWSLVMWLAIFPLLALLYGGLSAGWRGLGVSLATWGAMTLVRVLGWTGQQPATPTLQAIHAAAFLGAMSAIGAGFEVLRSRAVQRAEEASRARALFLATMSHELRTPMNGVIGITELLLAAPQTEAQRAQLELVRRSGNQMVALVNDLLDFTRIESGRLALEALPTGVGPIVEDVLGLMRGQAEEKGLRLVGEVSDRLPAWVALDPTRFRQILTNLVSNAVKFTLRGQVVVAVAAEAGRLRLTVRDTGIGIAPEALARLFQPFEQAEVSHTRRFGGSGLGLAICRRLVALMDGTLEVESREGVGSTFRVELPCVACAGPRQEAPSRPAAPAEQAARRVLLVEDNPINRQVALGMLARFGCAVEVAGDGEEAVEAVRQRPFDLVLMDCHMPRMDGFEATRRIRALPGWAAATRVVALTASAMSEELQQCTEAGMDGVLTKPLTLAALRKTLEGHGPAPLGAAPGSPVLAAPPHQG